MPTTRPDRRIQRTRQMLNHALIELILEQGYEAVKVQDILDRANIGRSTFYVHYRDKEELLLDGFEEVAQGFRHYLSGSAAGVKTEQAAHRLTLDIFSHAQSHRPLFKAMFGKQGGDVVVRHLRILLSELAGAQIRAAELQGRHFSAPADVIAHWLVSSFIAMLTWWLDQEIPQTAGEINDIFWRLSLPGIRAAMDDHTA